MGSIMKNGNKKVNIEEIKVNMKNFLSVPFQSESESTPLRRPQSTTGGGGAPKFFLNWLTFARSPYDADQI